MSAVTDAIIRTRGHLQHALLLSRRLDKALVDAALCHAGGSLDDAMGKVEWADTVLDALCTQVELCRIAIAREGETQQPVQSEEVAV
jgi:hypothetical protein